MDGYERRGLEEVIGNWRKMVTRGQIGVKVGKTGGGVMEGNLHGPGLSFRHSELITRANVC